MRKRLLSLLLVAALVTGLVLPLSVQAGNAQEPVNTGYNLGTQLPSESARFSVAYVRNRGAATGSNGTAKQLEVVVNLKKFSGPATVYAVVMRADDYATALNGGPAVAALDESKFFKLPVPAAGAAYYGMGGKSRVDGTEGEQFVFPIAQAGGNAGQNNSQNIIKGIELSPMTMPVTNAPASGDYYFDKYVLIVFAEDRTGATGQSRPDGNFYIDYFYLDANGYVARPSFGIRYNNNLNEVKKVRVAGYTPGVPTGNAGNNVDLFRAAWTDNRQNISSDLPKAKLTTTGFNGQGLKFMGWSETPQRVLAANEALPDGWAVNSDSYTFTEAYKIHTLYAIWQVIPVEFKDAADETSGVAALKFTATPQVGVPFESGAISYTAPGSAAGQPLGAKRFHVEVYEGTDFDSKTLLETNGNTHDPVSRAGGTPAAKPGSAENTNRLDAYQMVVTRYGLIVQNYDYDNDKGNEKNIKWEITGTPDAFSAPGNHVWFHITVQDDTNGSTDDIWAYFDQIKKGSQPSPTLDVNTGLEARVEALKEGDLPTTGTGGTTGGTTEGTGETQTVAEDGAGDTTGDGDETGDGETGGDDENEDPPPSITVPTMTPTKNGQIFGFYSKGAQSEAEKNNVLGGESGYFDQDKQATKGRDGTGTVTDYYLRLGMVFEYKPIQVGGEDLTDAYTDPNSAYSQMPNEGWREVPFPSGYYTPSMLTQLTGSDALARNGKTVLSSSKAEARTGNIASNATVALNAAGGYSETFQKTGWLDSYGKIVFEKDTGLPVIQLLNENDKYLIRFRATETYAASDAKEIVISGGGGGAEAKPDDFAAIIFYDWDETYLGAAVVAKNADAKAFQNAINDFVKIKYHGYTDGKFPADLANESYYEEPIPEGVEPIDFTPTYPLTYKKGYNFAGWVQVNGENTPTLTEAFTAYAKLGEAGEDGNYPEGTFNAEKFAPTAAPSGGWGNITLKAAYVENAHCNEGASGAIYTVTDKKYTRYGSALATTGDYSITLTIERKNAEGNGVTRLRKPALRMQMTPDVSGARAFFSISYVDGSDVATAEIVPSKGIKTVSYTLVDAYNTIWTAAGAKMSAELNPAQVKNTGGVQGSDGFIKEGTVSYICEQGIIHNITNSNTAWIAYVNAIAFQDAGLTYQDKAISSNTIANTIKPFILKALRENNNRPLSHRQLQHAIDNKGELLSLNTN